MSQSFPSLSHPWPCLSLIDLWLAGREDLCLYCAEKTVHLAEDRAGRHADPRLLQPRQVLPRHPRLPDGAVGEVEQCVALVCYRAVQSHHPAVRPANHGFKWAGIVQAQKVTKRQNEKVDYLL